MAAGPHVNGSAGREARGVRWSRVGLFYALAFGWVSLVAAGLFVMGTRDFGTTGAIIEVVRSAPEDEEIAPEP